MSLTTLKTKVEQLIEKAQSSGESGAIVYLEHGFTRPSWWLPRPEPTGNSGAWMLCEFPADLESYGILDLSDATIVKNGRKQKWSKHPLSWSIGYYYLSPNGGIGNSNYEDISNYAIELFLDYAHPVSLPYHY